MSPSFKMDGSGRSSGRGLAEGVTQAAAPLIILCRRLRTTTDRLPRSTLPLIVCISPLRRFQKLTSSKCFHMYNNHSHWLSGQDSYSYVILSPTDGRRGVTAGNVLRPLESGSRSVNHSGQSGETWKTVKTQQRSWLGPN